MTRILIRAGKSPFDLYNGQETFDRNIIGGNNGNLIFAAAAHKLLSADGVEVVAHGYGFTPTQADKANNEFDKFVIPLANAFRPSFEKQLDNTTKFIEKLKIPTVMLSGGAQSGPDGTFEHLKPMEGTVKAFCRAILKRSSHITVRGELTATYIRSLGFNDVIVIGCPSMTMNGRGHKVEPLKPLPRNLKRFRVAYNVETSKDLSGELIQSIEDTTNATYFPQDISTLDMMMWGTEKYPKTRDNRLPLQPSHEQFKTDKATYMLDAYTWIKRMKSMHISFGPRIHGNIAPILAGIPAVVFAHDTRTQELAEYHQIPHFTPSEISGVTELAQVIDRADFKPFNNGHSARFDKVTEFLNSNEIATIYDKGQEEARKKYEDRLKSMTFPDEQKTAWAKMSPQDRARLKHVRTHELKTDRLVATLRRELASAKEQISALSRDNELTRL